MKSVGCKRPKLISICERSLVLMFSPSVITSVPMYKACVVSTENQLVHGTGS